VNEYPNLKRREQVDLVVEQIRDELGSTSPTKHAIQKAQRKYSVSAMPSPFRGLQTDEHQQCITDFEHLFFYGIGPSLMSQLVAKMPPESKQKMSVFMACFKFPERVVPVYLDFPKQLSTANSMSLYRKMILYSVIFYNGLLPKKLYAFFLDFAHLSWEITRNGHTKDSVIEVNHDFVVVCCCLWALAVTYSLS
jgi:hypothetical protein